MKRDKQDYQISFQMHVDKISKCYFDIGNKKFV